jgi:hypothetical protein
MYKTVVGHTVNWNPTGDATRLRRPGPSISSKCVARFIMKAR